MLEFLIDNIYLSGSNGTFFNKSKLDIRMGTNYTPLLSNFFYAPMSPSLYNIFS